VAPWRRGFLSAAECTDLRRELAAAQSNPAKLTQIPGEETFFSIFGYTLCLEASSDVAREWVRRIYGAFECEPLADPLAVLEIAQEPNGGWGVRGWVDGESRFLSSQLELADAVEALEVAVCRGLMVHRSDWGSVHGAGKSTLSMALSAQGWKPGSDDAAFLLPGGELLPVARCVHLDEKSRELLSQTLSRMAGAEGREILTPSDLGTDYLSERRGPAGDGAPQGEPSRNAGAIKRSSRSAHIPYYRNFGGPRSSNMWRTNATSGAGFSGERSLSQTVLARR
jgi:hypothetical protein